MVVIYVKKFNIRDEKTVFGILTYDESKAKFTIDFFEGIDYRKTRAPMYVTEFAKHCVGTRLPQEFVDLWINDRIIPKERQNIDEILQDAGLTYYSPYGMLMACKGRCTFDKLYLEPIE